jgi:hypothetical protein
MSDELTPLQQSAAETGRRFFRTSEQVYAMLCADIDHRRGFPAPSGDTLRSLPLPEDTIRDATGMVLVSVETWRIEEADNLMLAATIAAGHGEELTAAEYEAAKPKEPAE